MKQQFSGSIAAIITPMHANGDIDFPALRRLVDWQIVSGTSAIVAVGTTGEASTLDLKEYQAVVQCVVEQAASRIPVIAGTGSSSTRQSVILTRLAKSLGADASLCVTPYYNKPTQQGLLEHYTQVAEAEELPLILYNVPSRTAVDLLPETVLQLSELENVVAFKEAESSVSRQRELIDLIGDKLILLSGDDATCLEFMLAGAQGVISVTANIAPNEMALMCKYALQSNISEAKVVDQSLQNLHRDLFLESNPIPIKWALEQMGMISSGIRSPLTALSKKYHNQLIETLRGSNINMNRSGEK